MFTHDFKLEFIEGTYEGQVEFNADGIASFKFNSTYTFNQTQLDAIQSLIDEWHKMYDIFGSSIKLIRVKEKS